jgi:hypothetical protein
VLIVLVKEARVVVAMDDLDFGIRNIAFEAKVLNRYGTFDRIANKSMEDSSYAYLHCDLLDRVALTTITLRVTSPHIKMHKQHLQKCMFMKVENFGIDQNPKGVLRKRICMLTLQLSQQPLCHQFLHSNPN